MPDNRKHERRRVPDRRSGGTGSTTPEQLTRLYDDFREPLSVILGYADLLGEVSAADHRQIYITGKLRAAAMRLTTVADSIVCEGGLIDQAADQDRRLFTRRVA